MAAVDLNTVRSTIEARLATELASSPAIPVVFSNMSFDSTTEDSFVQCITSFGQSEYLTQGDSSSATNNVVGLVVLNVFTEEIPVILNGLLLIVSGNIVVVTPACSSVHAK